MGLMQIWIIIRHLLDKLVILIRAKKVITYLARDLQEFNLNSLNKDRTQIPVRMDEEEEMEKEAHP